MIKNSIRPCIAITRCIKILELLLHRCARTTTYSAAVPQKQSYDLRVNRACKHSDDGAPSERLLICKSWAVPQRWMDDEAFFSLTFQGQELSESQRENVQDMRTPRKGKSLEAFLSSFAGKNPS